jgi:hypothetical protein
MINQVKTRQCICTWKATHLAILLELENRPAYRFKMSIDSMVPSKLSSYFTENHGHLSIRIPAYVKRLLISNIHQSSTFTKNITVPDKADTVSYLVAELVAQEMKPHATGESLILPACSVIVRTMFGAEGLSKDTESLVKAIVSCGDLTVRVYFNSPCDGRTFNTAHYFSLTVNSVTW